MTEPTSELSPDDVRDFIASFCAMLLGRNLGLDELLAEHLDSLSMLELLAAVEDFVSLPPGTLSDGAWDSYTMRVLAHRCAESSVPSGGGEFRLRPVADADFVWLHQLAAATATSHRWRLRGRIPTAPDFGPIALAHSFTSVVVEVDEQVAGLFCDYNADLQSQHVHACAVVASFADSATVMAAFRAYVDHLFRNWPFRAVYLEIPSFNMATISPTHIPVRLEAVLSEYEFYDGRWWDVAIYAIDRDAFYRHPASRADVT